jgi:2,4-dienoyl-CoA reductase-like NADH-dependent reductase (Old Yellow Enzyme family)
MSTKINSSTRRNFLLKIAVATAATSAGAVSWANIYSCSQDRRHFMVFSRSKIGKLRIKNRLVRSATLERSGSEGKPTEQYLSMYKSLAEGGIGLIMTGALAAVSPDPLLPGQVYAFEDDHIPGLKKIADTVHNADTKCKIFAQLAFTGNFSPSGIGWNKKAKGVAASTDEINQVIQKFAGCIDRVRKAGFDGAELHAHFIYPLSMFLSPITNVRNDLYGGTIENRVRLFREIVEEARHLVGREFPILIKVNCDDSFSPDKSSMDGTNLDNFHILASEIEKAGFDAIELSGNTMIRTDIDTREKESFYLKHAEKLDLKIPVIMTGGNRTIDHLEGILKGKKVDFLGMARPLIREPGLPNRWLNGTGSPSAKCISCNSCLEAEGPLRCIQENG